MMTISSAINQPCSLTLRVVKAHYTRDALGAEHIQIIVGDFGQLAHANGPALVRWAFKCDELAPYHLMHITKHRLVVIKIFGLNGRQLISKSLWHAGKLTRSQALGALPLTLEEFFRVLLNAVDSQQPLPH